MKNIHLRIILSFSPAFLLLAGCGTIATRTSARNEISDNFWPVYPATYCDIGLISGPFRPMDESVTGWKKASGCVVGLFDMPISLATDTLMLPCDIYVLASPRESKKDPATQ